MIDRPSSVERRPAAYTTPAAVSFTGVTMKPVERLSKRQRILTPPAFAHYLVESVRRLTGSRLVAVLYCDIHGPYTHMDGVIILPLWAQSYRGPYPVVAHPPCGPWGKFKWKCVNQDARLGVAAVHACDLFGGVVEQPVGSTLFRDHGSPEGIITHEEQGDYGHPSPKATILYWRV